MKIDSKTIYALSALIIALSIGYYFVIYLPQKDQRQIDMKKQEEQVQIRKEQDLKKQAEQEKSELEQERNTCMVNAQSNYDTQWSSECKSQGKLSNACIELSDMTFDDYAKKNKISKDDRWKALTDYFKAKDDCSCRLPLENADRITQALNDDKALCLKKYPVK